MKKLRVFRNWIPSKLPCDIDQNGNFEIVYDDSYDYAILMNAPNDKIKPLPKERVLGLAFEPHAFCNYRNWKNASLCNHYVIGDPSNLGSPFVEGHSYMYYYTKPYQKVAKKHPMCLMASSKGMLQGHRLRHQLIKEILKTNLDIHIYGRGLNSMYRDARVKGDFANHNEVYPNYHFTVAIENCIEGSYVTEKIFDPVYYHSCPIYWGCEKVGKYCNDFYYQLNGKDIGGIVSYLRNVYNNYMDFYNPKKAAIESSSESISKFKYLDFAYKYFETGKLDFRKI